MKTAALIVAAGRGTRARQGSADIPKQYRAVGGHAILDLTVRRFSAHPRVDAVVVCICAEDRDLYHRVIDTGAQKLLPAVDGGETRQASVFAGLQALSSFKPNNVLIHDAVRPFVSDQVIDNVILGLENEECVLPAVSVSDTLKQAEDSYLSGAVDRRGLYRAQTPQGFRFATILSAHEAALASGRDDFTDDSSIADWHGVKVRIVEGAERNIKVTTLEDFVIAEAMLMKDAETPNQRKSVRVGSGFDVHAFDEGSEVILCGVSIPHTRKLKGHSDADVGMHALTDALYGALCDGDIGSHFPPSDPQWKGADSSVFLRHAGQCVKERGGTIDHADVTLICQAPKIGPHRDEMRKRLGEILEISEDKISVKATTTERLGFAGREEGIAAMATATISLP